MRRVKFLIGFALIAVSSLQATELKPPIAARQRVKLESHSITRFDDYGWLRAANWREVMNDPSKLNPKIKAYLDAENRYADQLLAPLADLRVQLIKEMRGRTPEQDVGVPMRDGPYLYWSEFLPSAEHPTLFRMVVEGGVKELLLDGEELSFGKPYFSLGIHRHSPDHRFFAYLVDENGSEEFFLSILDTQQRGRKLPVVEKVSDFAWAADGSTLFYVRLDENHRGRFVYRHSVGSDPKEDELVYEEKELGNELSLKLTSTHRFVVLSSANSDTSESWLFDAKEVKRKPLLVAAREPNLRYEVDDWGDQLVIWTNGDGAADFKVMTAPFFTTGRDHWRPLIPYREGRRIRSMVAFKEYLTTLEVENGLFNLVVQGKKDGDRHLIPLDHEEAYDLDQEGSFEFDTKILRFNYSSLATPRRIFDYDMESRTSTLRKSEKIPSGHDPANYVVRRLFAQTSDGEEVPITLLHRKGVLLDGSPPLYLEGYGAYGYFFPTSFDATILSIVDRGFVYAIAHVRGGSEKGERWHDEGRREKKIHSFQDFIAVAERLIALGYTSRGRIVARGDSAGGLLMGSVINMRPDLFAGVIARVPFVDALNTMLDDTLPLTVSDFTEWGNPIKDLQAYHTIASYAPYENVSSHAYPHIIVTAGISDPRVQYWEEAKWVAKLRRMKSNDSHIALITRMSAGHFGASGRFEWLEELATLYAFAINAAVKS